MPLNQRIVDYFGEDRYTGTDVVKMIVIMSFSAISFMLTSAAPYYGAYPISPLVYCIPILLVALWYPRQGLRVTAFLSAGFILIRVYLSALGIIIDPVMTGLHTMVLFWVFGTTALFSQGSHLVASRCRQILEDTGEARFLCDPGTLQPVCVSSRCADILGYSPPELVGIAPGQFWADEDGRARLIEEMEREGYVGNMEMAFRAHDGEIRMLLLTCRALATENLFECTVVDTGRYPGEDEALARSNGRLMELIHQSNDIFFMQDTAGRILHFSWLHALEHGLSPDRIIGCGVDVFLPADLAAQHMEQVQKVVSERKSVSYDLDLMLEGDRHTFSVTISPYIGEDGAPVGIVGSARDITEIRRQKLACRQMSWEVLQWKGLIATLSHELRTPLQPLIGYLQMIVEDPEYYGLTEETGNLLKTCLVCADQELAVVERAVELSVITMDYVDLTIQDVELRELADSVITSDGFDPEAQIYNEIPGGVHIPGDPDRLYMVVDSLVSNAIKYSESPRTVWIRYAESNENHYIMVCDNGIGIPENIIGLIFEPFYIGKTVDYDCTGSGIGLGLSIANKYVRLHGGEITVTSAVGKGSTFTIRIPREV